MKGVLYVSHGTRLSAGKQQAIDFLTSIQDGVDAPLQEICFLEICTPSIEEGVHRLINRGATSITVVPVLLLSAAHDQEDIPEAMSSLIQQFPHLSFHYGKPIGSQERIIDLLEERIKAMRLFQSPKASILLVGRGSYYQSIQRAIEQMAVNLSERTGRPVETAYLAACKPSFDEALRKLQADCIVVPYLWFDGLLFQSMRKKANITNQQNHFTVELCEPLGHHPIIKQAVIDRANEAIPKG